MMRSSSSARLVAMNAAHTASVSELADSESANCSMRPLFLRTDGLEMGSRGGPTPSEIRTVRSLRRQQPHPDAALPNRQLSDTLSLQKEDPWQHQAQHEIG